MSGLLSELNSCRHSEGIWQFLPVATEPCCRTPLLKSEYGPEDVIRNARLPRAPDTAPARSPEYQRHCMHTNSPGSSAHNTRHSNPGSRFTRKKTLSKAKPMSTAQVSVSLNSQLRQLRPLLRLCTGPAAGTLFHQW